ncbi:MAG TPA: GNAT family N-acetyltransferase [Oscillospiraceae bacterium]|nr:GNAT family N-acetyltransferase [Oscillospiraceae bacterium]HPF55222.1 GNAT family N-acetyltransferase [Clostridiales bacterium]HPK36032.1 GNAT family N-acetyltransferase [Oscillospiraceae bacterium]HPR75963.1 GNAT family N-acetyltransferase [Oscillospiraceae bacterium]
MDISIRKLTPDLAEDYVRFFDATPHEDNVDEHKCYCVCWCNEDSSSGGYESKNLSSREKRRNYAIHCVKGGHIQGYLAYCGDEIVGWCNANTKADCLRCYSWRRFMSDIPVEESSSGIKVKSIYCFMIAPPMKRKGIATRLLERVCEDAAQEGFDFVEAYPYKEHGDQSSDFNGYTEMYEKSGFTVFFETKQGLVMRKQLK